MGIHEIKGIGPATVKKLNKAGVRTLDDLRTVEVDAVAEKTGIAERRLKEWKLEAKMTKVLEDVKGIGPASKKKLQDAGIHNVEDLVRASIHEVAHATSIAQERVAQWQTDAKKVLTDAQEYAKREYPQAVEKTKQAAADARDRGTAAYSRGREVAGQVATQARERGTALASDVKGRVDHIRHPETDGASGSSTKREAPAERPGLFKRILNVFSR